MARFYHYLDKLPRDDALRRTQIDCRAGKLDGCEGIDTSSLFYWAGFNLYGTPAPLELR